jgi:multiple sugar transport system permease protein
MSRTRGTRRNGSEGPRRRSKAGYLFVGGYALLLLLVGIGPTGYALDLAFTSFAGHFTGFTNFINTFRDFRFLPAFEHVAEFMGIWLTALIVIVIGVSLLIHTLSPRVSATFRFLFYLPAAFAGSAGVLVWLFMLQPGLSPWNFVLSALGHRTLGASLVPNDLPIVFAMIAFWTGAGAWILVIHGALTSIPGEVIEAAALDGASPVQTALHVKLPLIKKWVVYMLIVSFAGGTQLFAEPELFSQATHGILVSNAWSPNQLATTIAFLSGNFNYAAAISIDLLVVALICAGLLVFRTRILKDD